MKCIIFSYNFNSIQQHQRRQLIMIYYDFYKLIPKNDKNKRVINAKVRQELLTNSRLGHG